MRDQPGVEADRGRDAGDDAAARDQQVLGLEVAQDVGARGAERAADADLPMPLADPEARKPDDARRRDQQQRRADDGHQRRHAAILLVGARAYLRERAHPGNHAQAIGCIEPLLHAFRDLIETRRVRADDEGRHHAVLADRHQYRVQEEVVAPGLAYPGRLQALDDADDGARRRGLAGEVDRLAERIAIRKQRLRERLRDDDRRRLQLVADADLDHILGREVASRDELEAERGQRVLVGEVLRGVRGRLRLVLAQAHTRAPTAARERIAVRRIDIDDARRGADRGEVRGLQRGGLGGGAADADTAQDQQAVLVHARRPGDVLEPADDDEQRVADDGQRQRKLQADQNGAGLVAA